MNLAVFLRIVVQRGWLPVVFGAAGAVALYGFASTRPPVYEAESRVKIEAARPADFGQTQAINGVLRSYAADIATSGMALQVANSVGHDPGELLAGVGAGADESSREVRVRFRHSDPEVAERVADTWAKMFVADRRTASLALDERERVFASQRDSTTHRLYSPRKKLLTAAGAAAGIAVGLALAFVAEFAAASRIRFRSDVAVLGPYIGTVPGNLGPRPPMRLRGASIASAARLAAPLVALAILGAATAYAAAALRTPDYRARVRVAIEPARASDWGQTQAIREIMRGYGEDIATQRMAAIVAEREGLDLPAGRVLEMLNVAPNEDLYEIWIDVRHRDPVVATEISRTWAGVFVEERSRANLELDAVDRIYARIREQGGAEPYGPQPLTSGLAGGVIGLLAGGAVALALGGRKASLTTDAAGAATAAGAPALGLVPAAGLTPGARPTRPATSHLPVKPAGGAP